MNVGRYLRGEDRHVGTARTTQPQPPQRTEQEPVAHPERHELQAKGEHPAPCARHCEANAFQIVIKNLKAQLAQPEQEPVISKWVLREVYFDEDGEPVMHRSPPQRTWVWLTKVERIELLESTHPNNRWSLLALCEAKLKEKNGV